MSALAHARRLSGTPLPRALLLVAWVLIGVASGGAAFASANGQARTRQRDFTIGNIANPVVSCPGPRLCVAAGNNAHGAPGTIEGSAGVVAVFDPESPPRRVAATVLTRRAGGFADDPVSCPTIHQCSDLNGNGEATTFDPTELTRATSREINQQFARDEQTRTDYREGGTIACPTIHLCTALDGWGSWAVTFDPTSPSGQTRATISFPSSFVPRFLACASGDECVVLNATSEIVFNPVRPSSATAPVNLIKQFARRPRPSWTQRPSGYLEGLACPSRRRCIALSDPGELAFNPRRPGESHRGWLPLGSDTFADMSVPISCPDAKRCTAIDRVGGDVFTFNPVSTQSIKVATDNLGTNNDVNIAAVSCPSRRICAVLGYQGAAWAGRATVKEIAGCPIKRGTSCSRAQLSQANLANADLSHATLNRANLTRANLAHADLAWAELSEANLKHADLARANLSHANLRRASLAGADLRRARFCDTTMPGGAIRKPHCR
jgi:Pentapeptide repeats (8 copies)